MNEVASSKNNGSELLAHFESLANTTWIGQGKDTFPTPNGPLVTTYTETMTMGPSFQTVNGDPETGQKLLCVHYYTQLVNAETGVPMHQETGYWLLAYADNTFRKVVAIPRGIAILAGGTYSLSVHDGLVMTASAKAGDPSYGISNEPYLLQNAPTQRFTTNMSQTNDTYRYYEDSVLHIMGQNFNHTDEATLSLQP